MLLVPLYLTSCDLPLVHVADRHVLGGLAAGRGERVQRHAVKRFFDNLPREIFEAARVDGAGPFRLFWSIVLPMSRPILGVVSVFAVIATWKDYLWPLLVLPRPGHPAAVGPAADRSSRTTDLGVFLAALAISSLIPIALFLVFQRLFLRGAGLSGAIKG